MHRKLSKDNVKFKKTGYVTRFIFSFTVSFFMLTLILAISIEHFFSHSEVSVSNALNSMAYRNNSAMVDTFQTTLSSQEFTTLRSLITFCNNIENDRILASAIYGRTEDENYFKVFAISHKREDFLFPFRTSDQIKIGDETNFISEAITKSVADKSLYINQNIYFWNIYFPAKIGEYNYVVHFAIKADYMHSIFSNFKTDILTYRKYMFITISVFFFMILILSIIYAHNLSKFIGGLTAVVKNAASGESKVKIDDKYDPDFHELALSFNTLIENSTKNQSMGKPLRKEADGDKIQDSFSGWDEAFKLGVSLLKENKLDESEHVFTTIMMMNKESFGSYFNLGIIYAKKKKYNESLEMLYIAEKIKPEYALTGEYIKKIQHRINS